MKLINVVAGVVTKEDGTVLAVERGYGEYKGSWEFPGGKIEEGETPEEALARELKEELDIEVIDFKFVQTISSAKTPNFLVNFFICKIKEDVVINLKEHSNLRWLYKDTLDDVNWLPADKMMVEKLKLNYDKYIL